MKYKLNLIKYDTLDLIMKIADADLIFIDGFSVAHESNRFKKYWNLQ